jgi:hypothetical protein
MSNKIQFYVGILPEDREQFNEHIYMLNEDTDEKFHVHVAGGYDDLFGYYIMVCKGTWDAYRCFMPKENEQASHFVKSLEHFEEEL